jgi:regulator of sigma E protease
MTVKIPKESKQRTLGFSFKVNSEKLSLYDSMRLGAMSTWDGIKMQGGGLLGLARGTESASGVSGPIGIIKIGAQFASNGIQSTLYFLSILSIALGVFNLIPVPPLDGGRMVFSAIKAVSGYSVPPKVQGLITAVGVLALLALFLLATFKDVGFFG